MKNFKKLICAALAVVIVSGSVSSLKVKAEEIDLVSSGIEESAEAVTETAEKEISSSLLKALEESGKKVSLGTMSISLALSSESLSLSFDIFAKYLDELSKSSKTGADSVKITVSSGTHTSDEKRPDVLTYKYNPDMVKNVTDREYDILCRIIEAEAVDQDVYGRILVANVILNRVNYKKEFPNDIEGVVFEKNQFSPISNGAYYKVKVDDITREAVDRALQGEDYSDGALYFFMRSGTSKSAASWFDSLRFICKYGCHEFFKY